MDHSWCQGLCVVLADVHNLNLCPLLPNFWQELETFSLLSNGAPAGLTDQVGRGLRLQMFP